MYTDEPREKHLFFGWISVTLDQCYEPEASIKARSEDPVFGGWSSYWSRLLRHSRLCLIQDQHLYRFPRASHICNLLSLESQLEDRWLGCKCTLLPQKLDRTAPGRKNQMRDSVFENRLHSIMTLPQVCRYMENDSGTPFRNSSLGGGSVETTHDNGAPKPQQFPSF